MTRRILGRSEFVVCFAVFFWVVAGAVVAVFAGVFEKSGGWCGVFCGQSVVNCVVKLVR
jgi:hypothetical protein